MADLQKCLTLLATASDAKIAAVVTLLECSPTPERLLTKDQWEEIHRPSSNNQAAPPRSTATYFDKIMKDRFKYRFVKNCGYVETSHAYIRDGRILRVGGTGYRVTDAEFIESGDRGIIKIGWQKIHVIRRHPELACKFWIISHWDAPSN